jgi:hydroxylaminobenzene mutase
MTAHALALRQGHWLIFSGLSLFLLALFVGIAVPHFAVPRLALSAHLLGIMQGIFLMTMGLVWPRVALSNKSLWFAFCLLVYGCFAAWLANILAATWGAGNTLLPLAARPAHGSVQQETVIAFGLRSAAVALIISVLLLLWGLRRAVENRAVEDQMANPSV